MIFFSPRKVAKEGGAHRLKRHAPVVTRGHRVIRPVRSAVVVWRDDHPVIGAHPDDIRVVMREN